MRIDLIFPPLYGPDRAPYLSLPSLSAFLKENGYNVIQKDINIEIYHKILQRAYITDVVDKLNSGAFFKTSDTKKYRESLLDSASYVLDNIEEWKRILKSGEKEDIFKRMEALCGIDLSLEIVSYPYYPTRISLDNIYSRFLDGKKESLFDGAKDVKENFYRQFFIEYVKKDIRGEIVGISVPVISQLLPALTLAHVIKSFHPKTYVILGGPLVPYTQEVFFDKKAAAFIDGICIGEGETPFLKICENVEKGEEFFKNVPNLIYKDGTDLKKTQLKSFEDINILPCPNWEGYDLEKYLTPGKVLPLLTARGCYWNKCAFCSLCSSYSHRYRERKMELVIEDIRTYVSEYDVDCIFLNDECIPPRRLEEFSDALLSERVDVGWFSLVRFEKDLNREILAKAKKAGCIGFSVGLESASRRILNLMNKGIELEDAERILKSGSELGFWINVFAIIGFPTETSDDFMETVQFALKNSQYIDVLQIAPFRVEKGSRLYRDRKKFGIELASSKEYYDYFGANEYVLKSGMDQENIKNVLNRANERFSEHLFWENYYVGLSDDVIIYLCRRYGKSFITEYLMNNFLMYKKQKEKFNEMKEDEFLYIKLSDHTKCFGNRLFNFSNGSSLFLGNRTALYLVDLVKTSSLSLSQILDEVYKEYGKHASIRRDVVSFYSTLAAYEFIDVFEKYP